MKRSLIERLSEQPYRTLVLVTADCAILAFSAVTAFLLRFEGTVPDVFQKAAVLLLGLNIALVIPLFFWQNIYSLSLAFVSIRDAYRIAKVVALATVLSFAAATIARDYRIADPFPRSTILINAFVSLTFLSGVRIAKRLFRELAISKTGKRILIIGADTAGASLARSLLESRLYTIVGFLDDRPVKRSTTIHQIPVLGGIAELARVFKGLSVDEVIIAEPNDVHRVIELAQKQELDLGRLKVLPTVSDVIGGKITLANIRDISIEDLLGRDSVTIDTGAISSFLQGKRVMVTGAAGSIGSSLALQICAFQPSMLIAVDQNETGIFKLDRSLRAAAPTITSQCVVADVCDTQRMATLCAETAPHIIFHAAAYKHVPIMEANPIEAVKNNVFGTLSVAQAARDAGVAKFVLVSTDKAVRPVSVMGMTKRLCEMICVALHKTGPTKFCAVRFGNVLDSQGNVIEVFREAIRRGGPLEITHPDMQRYFMVTSEACLLVMQAGALSGSGEIFCLDMGEPVLISDLAKEMIRLAGFQPHTDIPIVFTNPRPGERLFEVLLTEGEMPTEHEKIFIARLHGNAEREHLFDDLSRLQNTIASHDESACRSLLSTLVSEHAILNR